MRRFATLLAAAALAGCGGSSGSTTATTTTNAAKPFPCASPQVANGQPAYVVILLDGVGSEETGGTYYPVAVASPSSGVPVVESYCPLDGSYAERDTPDLPDGLAPSLRRWSELKVAGGSSGGSSSTPDVSRACDRTETRTAPAPAPGPAPAPSSPGSGRTTTPTITTTIPGGFGTGSCLTEALANAGAILLPYSYAGATLKPDGSFVQQSYTADDSKQAICTSVGRLATEIGSVHSRWPDAAIMLVGHSYGGLVAETWWYDEHQQGGGQCGVAAGANGVGHVFSLDSPINGGSGCKRAGFVAGDAASTWCSLWGSDHGVTNGKAIAAIDDRELTYTAVGTPHDSTYGTVGTGGGLQAQLVYDCVDNADENDPSSSCIDLTGGTLPVSYPSASAQCDGSSGNVYGTHGHDIVKVCPPVVAMIVGALRAAPAPTAGSCSIPGGAEGGTTLTYTARGIACAQAQGVVTSAIGGVRACATSPGGCPIAGFSCRLVSPPPLQPGSRIRCTQGAREIDFEMPG